MITLAVLVLVLLGLFLGLGFVAAIVGLVLRLILLPFTIGWWLLKGVAGLAFGIMGLALLAVVLLLPAPALVLFLLLPLIVPVLLIVLAVKLARRHRTVRA